MVRDFNIFRNLLTLKYVFSFNLFIAIKNLKLTIFFLQGNLKPSLFNICCDSNFTENNITSFTITHKHEITSMYYIETLQIVSK